MKALPPGALVAWRTATIQRGARERSRIDTMDQEGGSVWESTGGKE